MAATKAKIGFGCILSIKTHGMGAPIGQFKLGGGMFMWHQPFFCEPLSCRVRVRHTGRILVDRGQDGEVCSETADNSLFRQEGLNRDLIRFRGENAGDIRLGGPVESSLNSASVPRW